MSQNGYFPARLEAVASRLAPLPEEERAVVEAMIWQLCDIPNVGPVAALDIVVKVGMWLGEQRRQKREALANV